MEDKLQRNVEVGIIIGIITVWITYLLGIVKSSWYLEMNFHSCRLLSYDSNLRGNYFTLIKQMILKAGLSRTGDKPLYTLMLTV